MNNNNKISIVIATYNRRNYLHEAIESILSQTYNDYEIIIINDCSRDDTVEFINKTYSSNEKIHFYTNKENRGLAYNHKLGLSYAVGKYVIFLDDDDKYINDNYFEEAIKLFDKHPEISFVSTSHLVYNTMDDSKMEKHFDYDEVVDNKDFFLHFASPDFPKPIISATIIKKSVFDHCNNNEIEMLNDVAIFLYALLEGSMGFVKDISAQYLVHGNNISFSCTTDFIIENLEEKYKVYRLAKNKFTFTKKQLEKWIEEQIDITVIYFINGSKPDHENFKKLNHWVRKRLGYKKYFEYKKIYKNSENKEKII